MFRSDSGTIRKYTGFVRPVISLSTNAIDISTHYNEDIGWSLK